jgi:hypothetical protein
MSSNNVLENAVLLSVGFHLFGTRKTIGSDEVETDADRKMIHVCKDLLESDRLNDVRKFDGKLRKRVKALTTGASFLRDGVNLLALSLVESTNAMLTEAAIERGALVDVFMEQYPLARDAARDRLGSLFNPADYPNAERVRGAFWLDWNFLEFHTPGKLRGVSPDVWAAQNAKLELAVESAADAAVAMLRAETAGLVDALVDRLAPTDGGKPKIFRDSLIGNVKGFLEVFKDRNFCGDGDLETIVKKIGKLVDGVNPGHLRDSDTLRAKVGAGFESIKGELDKLLVDRPRRRINLADIGAVKDKATGAAA